MNSKWKKLSFIGLILLLSMITGIIKASSIFYTIFFGTTVSLFTILPASIGFDLPKTSRRSIYIALGASSFIIGYLLFYWLVFQFNVFPRFLEDYQGLQDPKLPLVTFVVFLLGGIFVQWCNKRDKKKADSLSTDNELPITVQHLDLRIGLLQYL